MKKIVILLMSAVTLCIYSQPASFSSRGVGGGGALFSPSINPANPDEYYIACDMSELFHTTDYGSNYSQVHFTQFNGGHNSKVCYTNTPGRLYSISYIADVGTPVLSVDNGATWNPLPGNPDPSEEIYTIHADYAHPNRIIISDYGAIHFSANGGNSFTSIHTALSGSGNVVAGVFFDADNIYIGTNDGVLVSANGGSSWSMASISGLPAAEKIWSFTAAKVGSVTRFFCLTGDESDIYVGLQGSDYWGFFRNIYTCDYGSTNWTARSTGINPASDFPMFIDMAENDTATVYVAGSNDASEPVVLKTTNAGISWTHTFHTNNNQNIVTGWSGDGGDRGWSYGECPFGFDVAANNSQRVIFGDFGFCHTTSNGGTGWEQAYVNGLDEHPANANTPAGDSYRSIGLENTTCWQTFWIDANTMWSCYSDIRGMRSTDAGTSWSFNYTGNAANSTYRVVKDNNGNLYAACSNIHDMYQSTRLQDAILDANDPNGKIIYSTNNGQDWQDLEVFNHPVFWIALDPNNPDRAYASVIHYNGGSGMGGVYRCDNLSALGASTWTLLSNPPRTQKHPASLVVLNDGKLVATYSGRRDGSGFTASSGVFIYDPAGGGWTDVSDPGMYYWTKDIVIDPFDPAQNTWYAGVFSGWGGAPNGLGGLYKTTNRGTSWTKLTGTTLDRVTSCTFNPNDSNEIYVTTEVQGLWRSSDINAPSPAFSMVNSYPFRQPERVFFNPYNEDELWVTSFGNGMKVGLLNSGLGTVSFGDVTGSVYPNPFNDLLNFSFPANKNPQSVVIYDMEGRVQLSQTLKTNTIATGTLSPGIYLVEVQMEDGSVFRKKIVK